MLAVVAAAQNPAPAELPGLIRELRQAILSDSLVQASELAAKVDLQIDERLSASVALDGPARAAETLGWLPQDIESFWVNQKPFTIDPDRSEQLLSEDPVEIYSTDRLRAQNGGETFRALARQTVRLVVAAARDIGEGGFGVPGPVIAKEVVYFYFLDGPTSLPAADDSIGGRPAWRGLAKVDVPTQFRPGAKREQREDENWMVLAKLDVLILANRRELLESILAKMTPAAKAAPVPADLSAHVQQKAAFWGFRRRFRTPEPTGLTVELDAATRRLKMSYRSEARLGQNWKPTLRDQFQEEATGEGWQRLSADLKARGPWPVHFAMAKLGFGVYR